MPGIGIPLKKAAANAQYLTLVLLAAVAMAMATGCDVTAQEAGPGAIPEATERALLSLTPPARIYGTVRRGAVRDGEATVAGQTVRCTLHRIDSEEAEEQAQDERMESDEASGGTETAAEIEAVTGAAGEFLLETESIAPDEAWNIESCTINGQPAQWASGKRPEALSMGLVQTGAVLENAADEELDSDLPTRMPTATLYPPTPTPTPEPTPGATSTLEPPEATRQWMIMRGTPEQHVTISPPQAKPEQRVAISTPTPTPTPAPTAIPEATPTPEPTLVIPPTEPPRTRAISMIEPARDETPTAEITGTESTPSAIIQIAGTGETGGSAPSPEATPEIPAAETPGPEGTLETETPATEPTGEPEPTIGQPTGIPTPAEDEGEAFGIVPAMLTIAITVLVTIGLIWYLNRRRKRQETPEAEQQS